MNQHNIYECTKCNTKVIEYNKQAEEYNKLVDEIANRIDNMCLFIGMCFIAPFFIQLLMLVITKS